MKDPRTRKQPAENKQRCWTDRCVSSKYCERYERYFFSPYLDDDDDDDDAFIYGAFLNTQGHLTSK